MGFTVCTWNKRIVVCIIIGNAVLVVVMMISIDNAIIKMLLICNTRYMHEIIVILGIIIIIIMNHVQFCPTVMINIGSAILIP